VYPTAAIVVKYDPIGRRQEYFLGHNDDVICLAQCAGNIDLFASGQVATIVNGRATPPHICIWNGKTMQQLVKIAGAGQRAIRALGFSPSGAFLASGAYQHGTPRTALHCSAPQQCTDSDTLSRAVRCVWCSGRRQ
jgi:lipoxygenase homology domain-containing protein 1